MVKYTYTFVTVYSFGNQRVKIALKHLQNNIIVSYRLRVDKSQNAFGQEKFYFSFVYL